MSHWGVKNFIFPTKWTSHCPINATEIDFDESFSIKHWKNPIANILDNLPTFKVEKIHKKKRKATH